MLETHYLISRLISPVTISRSRNWLKVQPSLEHLKLSYFKLFFYKNWECFSVTWHWLLRTSITNRTSPTPARWVEAIFFKNCMQCHRSGIYKKKSWNTSPSHYSSFCEKTNKL